MTDLELLLLWTAEEFVAAGRAQTVEDREAHRNHAIFYSDLSRELDERRTAKPTIGRREDIGPEGIGRVLARAFPLVRETPRQNWRTLDLTRRPETR